MIFITLLFPGEDSPPFPVIYMATSILVETLSFLSETEISPTAPSFQNLPLDQRPREKLAQGDASVLSNPELLAVLLGRGHRGKDVLTLAHEIAEHLASLSDIPTLEDLCRIPGVGAGKGAQILAALELSRRFLTRKRRIRIQTPLDALPLLSSLRGRRQECFMVLTLDGVHQVIKAHEITVGLVNQSQVHPRETFAIAMEDRAVSIMVAHNHPSGSPEPSADDMTTTRRLVDAGKLLGIPVLDHVILGEEGFVSLRERYPEYFQPFKRPVPPPMWRPQA